MSDSQDRIAVVTGASRGLGRAIALGLAKAGAHVVAIARPKSEGALVALDDAIQQVTGEPATLVPLDLTDGKGVDNLGAALFERYGRIDALVGNAGLLGPITPVAHIVPKEWDKTVAVNLTANYRLIRSFDPLLRAAPAGRAVFVTSGAVSKKRAYWGAYSVTKVALEALVETYAKEVGPEAALKVNLFDPGPVRTDMRAEAFPGEDPMSLPAPDDLVPTVLDMLSPDFPRHGERVSYQA